MEGGMCVADRRAAVRASVRAPHVRVLRVCDYLHVCRTARRVEQMRRAPGEGAHEALDVRVLDRGEVHKAGVGEEDAVEESDRKGWERREHAPVADPGLGIDEGEFPEVRKEKALVRVCGGGEADLHCARHLEV